MRCPWCFAEFVPVAQSALFNVEQYGNSVTSVAQCCGNVVRIGRIIKYDLQQSGMRVDDWGNKATSKVEIK